MEQVFPYRRNAATGVTESSPLEALFAFLLFISYTALGNRIITQALVTLTKAGVRKLQIERIMRVITGFGYWIPAVAGTTAIARLP